mmetsp:Transcript_90778/g.261570  ORF Transcript_90778/g.261570 Transcript_90778/m.261570 type:complete len:310 (+) Transcript_90778:310-1239(+)
MPNAAGADTREGGEDQARGAHHGSDPEQGQQVQDRWRAGALRLSQVEADVVLRVEIDAHRAMQASRLLRARPTSGAALLLDHVVRCLALVVRILDIVRQGPEHAVSAGVLHRLEGAHFLASLERRCCLRLRSNASGGDRCGRLRRCILCRRGRRRRRRFRGLVSRRFGGRRFGGRLLRGLRRWRIRFRITATVLVLAAPPLPLGGPQMLPVVVLCRAIIERKGRQGGWGCGGSCIHLWHRRPVARGHHLPQGAFELPLPACVCDVALHDGPSHRAGGGASERAREGGHGADDARWACVRNLGGRRPPSA